MSSSTSSTPASNNKGKHLAPRRAQTPTPDPPAEQVASKRERLICQIKNLGAEPDEPVNDEIPRNVSVLERRRILKKNLDDEYLFGCISDPY